MKKIVDLWYKLDEMSRLGIGCFALYMLIYVLVGALENLTGAAM